MKCLCSQVCQNRSDYITWQSEPLTGVLSIDIKNKMIEINKLIDPAVMLKAFIIFFVSNLFFLLDNLKTPRKLMYIASNVDEFSFIHWIGSIREFLVYEFNKIAIKFALKKPLDYINDFVHIVLCIYYFILLN
ncbi:hypothetical protein KFK09_026111 [Dendrobium nobile]|uniref:Uncharacterized protein n=1 Tax=Dendrobium nobile TaxID=94219 RepID=A0A8T3A6J9_DENNO|nr:hypothetical protein KFK09_026111 [Dendrobium nobile]